MIFISLFNECPLKTTEGGNCNLLKKHVLDIRFFFKTSTHCKPTDEFTSDLQTCDEDLQSLARYVTVLGGDVPSLGTHPCMQTLTITLTPCAGRAP